MTWMILTLTLASLGFVIKTFLNLHNISYIKDRQDQVPPEFAHKITADQHLKAAQYSIVKLRFGLFSMFYSLLLFIIYLPLGLLGKFNEIALSFGFGPVLSGIILFLIFSLVSTVLELPLEAFSTFGIEQKFGFNRTTGVLYFKDLLKNILLSAILGGAVIALLVFIIENVQNWWLLGWGSLMGFQLILVWAYPRFISPWFNKFSPLEDQSLQQRITELLKRTQIKFKDIFVMDASLRSTHGNAYFTGFGQNRRIVFFDTLLKSLNHGQIEAVLAHELGHLKHKHILKSLLLSTVSALLMFVLFFYLYNHSQFMQQFNIHHPNPAVFLILVLLVLPHFTFGLQPILAWFSRKNEYEADQFAVTYSNGEDMIDALLALYRENSSTLTPAPLYWKFHYSHPPALERIEHIKHLMVKQPTEHPSGAV